MAHEMAKRLREVRSRLKGPDGKELSTRAFAKSLEAEYTTSHTMVLRYEDEEEPVEPPGLYLRAISMVHRVAPDWLLCDVGLRDWAPESSGRRDQLAAASYMRQFADQLETDALAYARPIGKVEPEDFRGVARPSTTEKQETTR